MDALLDVNASESTISNHQRHISEGIYVVSEVTAVVEIESFSS